MNLIDLNTRIKIRSIQQFIIIKNVDSAILGLHLRTKQPPKPENHWCIKRRRSKYRT